MGYRKRNERKLDRIIRRLDTRERIMATLVDIIASLNNNTNAVAVRMDALLSQLSLSGKAPTQEQLDSLQAISDHLKQLGADPANPVPPAFPAGSPDAAASPPAASAQGLTPNGRDV